MSQAALKYFSEEAYLDFERESTERHTYYAGEIFAMAGASYEHNVIEDNMRIAIGNFLKDKSCRSFGSNLRVHSPGQAFYTYPDILVICNGPKFLPDTFDTVTNPSILIEILSEGTADFDKGLKFDLYRRIATLQEYLLVDSRRVHLMHYVKNGDSSWTMHEYSNRADLLLLKTIEMPLSLADCYTGLELT